MAPVAQTGAGNVTTATVGAGSSVTVAKPSNLTDGDLLVAVVNHHVGNGTWSTVPSGWTAVTTFATGRTAGVWIKAVPSAAAETAPNYTWATTGTGSGRMGGLIVRVTGADLGAPVDAVGTWQAALGATGVTTTRPDCLLLGAYWSYIAAAPNTVNPPATMTAVGSWQVQSGSSSSHLLAAENRPTPGATGSRTATATPAGSSALSILVALAAPQDASATITQQTAVTASAALDIPAAADLVQPTAVTAHAEVLAADQQASASLVQPTRVVVAHPAQPRILVGGQWQPTSGYLLINGSWVRLTSEEDED